MMEEDAEQSIFEDRIRPLFQRLSINAQDRFNPKFYAESIAKTFLGNFERHTKRMIDEATRKYKKQLNRLISQGPRTRVSGGYKGPNPATEPADILKLIKHAIEQETKVRIQYLRSSGEIVNHQIEPETLQQGRKLYALCEDDDEHHLYVIDRIQHASL